MKKENIRDEKEEETETRGRAKVVKETAKIKKRRDDVVSIR